MTNPETIIQNNIILELNKRNHRLWRANAGKIKTEQGAWIKLLPKGFPDTLGFRNSDGKFIAIEVKTQSGKLREEQKRFRDFAINQPIIYGVARSVEDAIDIVENGKELIQ
nr:VRR-NUC domain-containing protein [Mammaliicoccus sp. Marseille-Q6498]